MLPQLDPTYYSAIMEAPAISTRMQIAMRVAPVLLHDFRMDFEKTAESALNFADILIEREKAT